MLAHGLGHHQRARRDAGQAERHEQVPEINAKARTGRRDDHHETQHPCHARGPDGGHVPGARVALQGTPGEPGDDGDDDAQHEPHHQCDAHTGPDEPGVDELHQGGQGAARREQHDDVERTDRHPHPDVDGHHGPGPRVAAHGGRAGHGGGQREQHQAEPARVGHTGAHGLQARQRPTRGEDEEQGEHQTHRD